MKNVLIAGCSYVQRMADSAGNDSYDDVVFRYASYGGQGLWKIEDVLQNMSKGNPPPSNHQILGKRSRSGRSVIHQNGVHHHIDIYDYIIVQLTTPIRNTIGDKDTTKMTCKFIDSFDEIGKDSAFEKNISEYKQKIKDINLLHKNVVFFLYNVGGYPFKHPVNYSDEIVEEMYKFFEDYNFIHLSFEGQPGYHFREKPSDDEEFVDYWYESWPPNLKGKYNEYCSMSKVPGVLIEDPHPNKKADIIALEKIYDYITKN